jgi:aryl-alcohol dehydrogenase-like predicted oxidoreductase
MAVTETRVPRRQLGSTGESVSMLGLGGFHLSKPTEAEAIRIVHAALDAGLDFLDNSWDYAQGSSEERMGKALEGRRDQAFLMTKVDGRTKVAARAQLEESLQRLRTDHVDLWQFHEVIRFEDAEQLFERGGMEAAIQARDRGQVRFIGFTGHKDPDIHLHMLHTARAHGFHFDTVQMPVNVMDAGYERSFIERVLPVLEAERVGVLGMKPIGDGTILEAGVIDAPTCLRFALSLPTDVVITGCDTIGRLKQALQVAATFQPMTEVSATRSCSASRRRPRADGTSGTRPPTLTTARRPTRSGWGTRPGG